MSNQQNSATPASVDSLTAKAEQMFSEIAEQQAAFNLVFDEPVRCNPSKPDAVLRTILLTDPTDAITENTLQRPVELCWFEAVVSCLEAEVSEECALYFLRNVLEALQAGSYKVNQQITQPEIDAVEAFNADERKEIVDVLRHASGGEEKMQERLVLFAAQIASASRSFFVQHLVRQGSTEEEANKAADEATDYRFAHQFDAEWLAIELLADDIFDAIIEDEATQEAIEDARSVWNDKYDELTADKDDSYDIGEDEVADEQLGIAEDAGRSQLSDALREIASKAGYDFTGRQWDYIMSTRHFEELTGNLYM